nr:ribonuclease R [Lachnospiraceae bacterium]
MLNIEELENKKTSIYEFICSKEYTPIKMKELASLLNVPKKDRKDFRQVMDSLLEEGKIIIDPKGLIKSIDLTSNSGKFSGTSKGYGFIMVEGLEEDFFVAESNTLDAMNGDTVLFEILTGAKSGHRTEAKVIKVLERAVEQVVGTYSKSRNFGFVVPDNTKIGKDIYIPKAKAMGAVNGHKVVVKITDYGDKDKNPEGEIIEIIGHINDPGVDIISIIKAFGLPEEYPKEVMNAANNMPESVDPSDISGRVDLREWQTVTIDGEDAKDLDDAITLTKENGQYKLGVHIADVSHYVKENSPLDKEALKRGTSVYLVDRVIPMLPHKLSNGICSLNQGEDRLALSCIMDIDTKGNVIGHKICETVVNVDRRMSYTQV